MPEETVCPAEQELLRFHRQQSSADEHLRIVRHLRKCSHCRRALGKLPSGETPGGTPLAPPAPQAPAEGSTLRAPTLGDTGQEAPPPLEATALPVVAAAPPSSAEQAVPTLPAEGTPASPSSSQTMALPAGEGAVVSSGLQAEESPSAQGTLPAEEGSSILAPAEAPDELGRLGGYRILGVLGAGGMGVVFLAEDIALERQVALKVIKPTEGRAATARERFLREARATAAIQHDNIVPIYHVGEDRGVPFLAMPFLQGQTLDTRLRDPAPLSLAEVLRITREIAAGLHAAHSRGLIHRDIKPANLWLEARPAPLTPNPSPPRGEGRKRAPLSPWGRGVGGEGGRVKILDFGLARAIEGEAHLTQSGMIAGTPAFMSPEQAGGEEVDARCDLFSLGCILYLLSTRREPFTGDSIMAVLLAVTRTDPDPPRKVNPEVPAVVSDLAMWLLAKDRELRPASAQEVVERIEALEAGIAPRPIPVPPPTATMPLPEPNVLPTNLDVALLASAILRSSAASRQSSATRPRPSAPRDSRTAPAVPPAPTAPSADKGSGEQRPAAPARPADSKAVVPAAAVGPKTTPSMEEAPAVVPPRPATARPKITTSGAILAVAGLLVGAILVAVAVWVVNRPKPASVIVRVPETDVRVTIDGRELVIDPGEREGRLELPAGSHHLVVTRGGQTLFERPLSLAAGEEAFVRASWQTVARTQPADPPPPPPPPPPPVNPLDLLEPSQVPAEVLAAAEADAGNPLPLLAAVFGDGRLRHWGAVVGVGFGPDGKGVVSGGADGILRLWDTAGRPRDTFPAGPITVAAFGHDGEAACGGSDGVIQIWDLTAGKRTRTLPAGTHGAVRALAFRGDGEVLACGGAAGVVEVFELASKRSLILTRHEGGVACVAFSPDGKTLASAGADGQVQLTDPNGGPARPRSLSHPGVRVVAFSANSKTLASAGSGGEIRLWEAATRRELAGAGRLPGDATALAFSPDGKTLAAAGGGAVRLSDPAGSGPRLLPDPPGMVRALTFRPDGGAVVASGPDGSIRLWDTATGKLLPPASPQGANHAVVVSADGRLIAAAGEDGTVRAWEVAGGAIHELPDHAGGALALSPDGKTLATGGQNGAVRLWETKDWKESGSLPGHKGEVRGLAFSLDGRLLASAGSDGGVRLWEDRREVGTLPGHPGGAWAVAFSPDGRTLASAGQDGAVRLWNTAQQQELPGPAVEPGAIRTLAFSPDGKLLAWGGAGGTVRLWVVGSKQEVAALNGHAGEVFSVAFSPEGSQLASTARDGTVRFWDAAGGAAREVLRLGPPAGEVLQVAFSPRTRHLVTANGNGTVYVLRRTGGER